MRSRLRSALTIGPMISPVRKPSLSDPDPDPDTDPDCVRHSATAAWQTQRGKLDRPNWTGRY
jgi:hypothetical protein